MTVDLRLGSWESTMADVECDALITDPPYSARTHEGHRSGRADPNYPDHGPRPVIEYEGIERDYCHAFVQSWAPRVRSWWVIFGDHTANDWWLEALDTAGFYTFAPVIWIKREAPPRFTGDGPASHVEYLAVARPKRAGFAGWGSLPGFYDEPKVGVHGLGLGGEKPEGLMRALVRDYSRPGWTIADPHAGSGTTLVAARAEGRHCIGSEKDPKTYEIARKRLAQPFARELFQRMAE